MNVQLEHYLSRKTLSQQERDHIQKKLSSLNSLFDLFESKEINETVVGREYVSVDNDYQGVIIESVECIYKKPCSFQIFGSWLSNTVMKQDNDVIIIDIAIEMPTGLVTSKDDTNFKYIILRNFYLKSYCNQFSKATKKSIFINKSDLTWHGEFELMENCCVHFHVNLPRDQLNQQRLTPLKNNIRYNDVKYEALPPTPRYNALLCRDVCNIDISKLVATHASNDIFCKAVLFLKLFAVKKELHLSSTSIAYLTHLQMTHNMVSSVQLVKAVLKSIPFAFDRGDKFVTLYIDNCCLDAVPINRFDYIKQYSEFALSIIDIDPLVLFNDKTSWDNSFECQIPSIKPSFYTLASKLDIFKYDVFIQHALERLISQALPFIKIIKITAKLNILTINIIVNEQPSLLLRGPSLQSPNFIKFQKLWGPRCQQRKFKDGFVNVCIPFESLNVHDMVVELLNIHLPNTIATSIPPPLPLVDVANHPDEFFKFLIQLDLPLQITHVHHIYNNCYYALELETSMSWPDNLIIMQQVKLIYLIRIMNQLTDYSCKLVVNTHLKQVNPFSMHQQLHVTVNNKVYKLWLLVDRELTLLNKELNCSQVAQVDYPDSLIHQLPNHIVQSELNVQLLKRKAGDYMPINATPFIEECIIAYTFIQQTIVHTRELKRCSEQYPLFKQTVAVIKELLFNQGVLGMIKSNDVIDFNCGGVSYFERYLERMTMAVFVHRYPYSNVPGSMHCAIERVFDNIKNERQCWFDMDGQVKVFMDSKRYPMVKTPLDFEGNWFKPYESRMLLTMFKELKKKCTMDILECIEKKVFIKVDNALQFEMMMNKIYGDAVIVQTNKKNAVFGITSRGTLNESNKDFKRLAKMCH